MRTRFAPSPTGPLHLGHAYSALLASDMARRCDGVFLLRIEDIDQSRARRHWERQIYDDLHWLGIDWPEPVMRQSQRMATYHAALKTLWDQGFLYPCSCNRRDIMEALSAPQEDQPQPMRHGPDGLIYPGTCRSNAPAPPRKVADFAVKQTALRLDMARALARINPQKLRFCELSNVTDDHAMCKTVSFTPQEAIQNIGDIVLSRRDMGTSYHLSVVLDDAAQQITHVLRGRDLFEATKIHVILQCLLELPTPFYHHHRLIRDESGKRLAKRDDARALSLYRAQGVSPDDLRKML